MSEHYLVPIVTKYVMCWSVMLITMAIMSLVNTKPSSRCETIDKDIEMLIRHYLEGICKNL